MGCGNRPIDIVLPWVDGNDPVWKEQKEFWQKKLGNSLDINSNADNRYQSWDNLQYWFRSVEKNLDWVRKIFFVTCGHIPFFLNTDNPKLVIVKHEDFIPMEYLPTFNSNTIEMNLWRIEALSENFIIFNDDLFPLRKINEDYFFSGDEVCDEAVESPIMPVDIGNLSGWSCRMKANNILFLNRHFNKREVQARSYEKWFCDDYGELLRRNQGLAYWNNFCGFHDSHMASSLKKSTLKKLWDAEPETMAMASNNKFRGDTDVSWYLARYWQLCEGKFVPRKTEGKSFLLRGDNTEEVVNVIMNQSVQMISLSEDCSPEVFETIKRKVNAALGDVFDTKSEFEK